MQEVILQEYKNKRDKYEGKYGGELPPELDAMLMREAVETVRFMDFVNSGDI